MRIWLFGFYLLITACTFEASITGGDSLSLPDTEAPSTPTQLDDGMWSGSISQSPVLNWIGSSDTDSGVQKYQVQIIKSSDNSLIADWQDFIAGSSLTGLTLSDATEYKFNLRAIDNAGNISDIATSDGWIVDTVPPTSPGTVNDLFGDTSVTQSPIATWTASADSGSGLSHYEMAVGTSSDSTDIQSWQSVGNVSAARATGLSLTAGNQYYISVRAIDSAGNASAPTQGNGWMVLNIDLDGPACASGSAHTVATDGALTFLGGNFTQFTRCTGSGAPVDTTTGALAVAYNTLPIVIGSVQAVVSDNIDSNADGVTGWYIGGSFTSVGGVARSNLAHIKEDGSLDLAWDPSPNNTVAALTTNGSTLYVGGAFTNIGGQARNYLAALDSSGTVMTWNPNPDNTILALAVSGSLIYVSGSFSNIGGQARTFLAAIDQFGVANGWSPNPSNWVYAIAISGSTVYVGGNFSFVGGQLRIKIAALDATSGLATAWNPSIDDLGYVFSLGINTGVVYVGGNFSSLGGQPRTHLGALDTTTGLATAWAPNPNGTVKSILVGAGSVFAGGSFSSIGGQPRNYLAEVNTTTGTATSWNPNPNATVSALAGAGTHLYVGGSFSSIGPSIIRNRLAALDGQGNLTSWDPNSDGAVSTIAVNDNQVFVGGVFSNIGGQARNKIADIAANGSATTWNANLVGGLGVNKILVNLAGDSIYVAGNGFTNIGGQARKNVAALGMATGLATAWNPDPDGQVHAVFETNSKIYLSGGFTFVGGQARNILAEVDKNLGAATAWNPSPNNVVHSIAVDGSTVYVGGNFSTIGGQARNKVAALDTSGNATAWNPDAVSAIYKVAVKDGTVYVGGMFYTGGLLGGQPRSFLAAVDGATGLATTWNPKASNTVYDFTFSGSTIYAAGDFHFIGGAPRGGLGAIDLTSGLIVP